ncbi:hypothetical protein [Alkalihalobacillus sp. TS-13]|uniref:hypothetical protein n=1 Tax=Alkalihalobacillus sp. TS-13 TaxID=2842455 RepID=UPI001C87DE3B|nr:hypothetical protein [Alkalihalobacillus sp. TS-13]
MENVIIKRFHKNEIRFAFVNHGRLYTLLMVKSPKWSLKTFDKDLIDNPIHYKNLLNEFFSSWEILKFLSEQNIKISDIQVENENQLKEFM